MAQKRKDWNGLISGFKASDLVFLDESGCNTDMTRQYAYSLGGSRAVDSAPLSKPKNTTILSSIQLDGTLRYTTFSGGTTVERFKRYLEIDLLPHLNDNSVLIMDNMKSHHPIEKLWSTVKSFLRNSRHGPWMLFRTRYNALFRQFRLLTAQAGSIPAAIRLIFENCYKTHFAGAPAQRKIPGGSPCTGCLPLTFSAWRCPESKNSPVGGGTGCTQTADRRR